MVHLLAGQDVLSINGSTGSAMTFEVSDSPFNLDPIAHVEYQKDINFKWGAYPYYVNIPSDGDYYVKVFNNQVGSPGDYLFTIGSPNYTVSSYEYTSPRTLTLTPTIKTAQDSYDFTNISSVPQKAMVYQVTFNGTKVNSATSESRSLKLNASSIWTTTSSYTWIANFSVARPPSTVNKYFHDKWDVKIGGTVTDASKPYSLTPKVKFSYVFPVLPQ